MAEDYTQKLSQSLEAARKRVRQGNEFKALQSSAPSLFEVMDVEISLSVNKMTAEQPLSYEEYLSEHGKVVGIRKVRNLIDTKVIETPYASEEASAIQQQLKQFKDDKK